MGFIFQIVAEVELPSRMKPIFGATAATIVTSGRSPFSGGYTTEPGVAPGAGRICKHGAELMPGIAARDVGSVQPGTDGRCGVICMNSLRVDSLTGAELKAIRRTRGINQTRMGQLIGCSRHAVSYWETQPNRINLRWGVPARMVEYLGVCVLPINYTSTRGRGDGVLLDSQQTWHDRQCARINAGEATNAARYRHPCQARTRKGHPCRNKSEPGRRRCKFHGGLSTGPKTPEGKARIAEAQRARWQAFRAVRATSKIG